MDYRDQATSAFATDRRPAFSKTCSTTPSKSGAGGGWKAAGS
ncbi:hypothetical protein [Afipia felis]|nr:hypothetical protein [Afipia felis]